ncbi:hypothetical protein [Photobacterium sanctipauli]|nr:hypothetical protein [Photobacterium sanctipauli]
MFEAIKNVLRLKPGQSLLASHYRARLVKTRNLIEKEAILYMSSLLDVYAWNQQDKDEPNKK